MHPPAHCSFIYIRQDLEATLCPSVDEWIKELWDIYTIKYFLAIKKEENFTLWDSMCGPGENYLSEISPSEKDKYHMISLICGN